MSLDSSAWDAIPSSPTTTGMLTAKLLRDIRDGDVSAYDEFHHQVVHQFSVGAVAYVAAPHLIKIALSGERAQSIPALNIVGTVAAGLLAYPQSAAPMRDEWRAEYSEANSQALRLAADLLGGEDALSASDTQQLLATVAALRGQKDLAMHLFSQIGSPQLECPACGEAIEY